MEKTNPLLQQEVARLQLIRDIEFQDSISYRGKDSMAKQREFASAADALANLLNTQQSQ